jgi:Putative adhesin
MTRMSTGMIVMTATAAAALLTGCAGPTQVVGLSSSLANSADVRAATDDGGPAAADADPSGQQKPTETADQIVDGVRTLVVSDDSGSVTVTAAPGPGVHIVKKIFANPTRPQEQVTHTGSDLRITAPYCAAPDWRRPCRIDYEIQAPADIAVTLTTASGNLTLAGLTGTQSAVAASGSVRVTAAGGPVNAQSTSGSVDVTATAVPQTLTASSVSGNASVHVPSGHYRVETATATGNSAVTLDNDPAGSALLRVTTVTGNVTLGATR